MPRLALVLTLVFLVPAWAHASVDQALGLASAGQRERARAVLDSLLAGGALQGGDRDRAVVQRALLAESGLDFETRAREALASEAGRAMAGRLHLELGHVAMARGDLGDALAAYRDARERGMDEEGSLWEGLALLALGDGVGARSALKRAAESGNAALRARARLATADAYRAAGDWDKAASMYESLGDDPANGWRSTALWHYGVCQEAQNRMPQARDAWSRLVALAPASLEAPLARARLRATEDWETASLELETVTPEETPAESAEPPPGTRFAIQVGAFSVGANADGLAQALNGRGVSGAFVERSGDGLSRVFVGWYDTRTAAEAAGDSLSGEFGFGFTVIAREPE